VGFQIDLRDCGPEGRAVVVTTWMDLGEGLDVDDPKWTRLVNVNVSDPRRPECVGIGVLARNLYQYSMTSDEVLDIDPTHRNFLYLLGRVYRSLMQRRWCSEMGTSLRFGGYIEDLREER
jgi:hypothetical protein